MFLFKKIVFFRCAVNQGFMDIFTRLSRMKRWDERRKLKITERLFLRVVLIFVVIHSTCKHALRKGSTIKRWNFGQRRKSARIIGFLSS